MASLRIGDLARLGGVSVRMLRHYHELGLLVAAEVDGLTGYRSYDHVQIGRLRRLVALRDVGLGLVEIGRVLDGEVEIEATLEAHRRVLADEAADVDRRLALLGELLALHRNGNDMTDRTEMLDPAQIEFEVKAIESRLVAQLTAVADSWAPTDIGPTIQPLYPELMSRMEAAGVKIAGPSTAWYGDTEDGRIAVHATLAIAARPSGDVDFEVLELPGIAQAACAVHRGTMHNCEITYQALVARLQQEGWTSLGYSRELDIECGPDVEWVTELQIPVERA